MQNQPMPGRLATPADPCLPCSVPFLPRAPSDSTGSNLPASTLLNWGWDLQDRIPLLTYAGPIPRSARCVPAQGLSLLIHKRRST